MGAIDEYNIQILSVVPTVSFQSFNVPQFPGDSFGFSNNSGHLLGVGLGAGTWTQEAAIATPEPSSVLLLASGLGLLALLAKRAL